MGWTFGWNSRKELIAHLLDQEKNFNTLARVVKREDSQDVLWAVIELTEAFGNPERVGERNILCFLLSRSTRDGHGYKDMCEEMGPYFFSCPLEYLAMTPRVKDQNWRDKVQLWHTEYSRREIALRMLRVGQTVKLRSGCLPSEVTLTSLKPLRGEANGTIYRLTPRYLSL